jgi:hypothetical protein
MMLLSGNYHSTPRTGVDLPRLTLAADRERCATSFRVLMLEAGGVRCVVALAATRRRPREGLQSLV